MPEGPFQSAHLLYTFSGTLPGGEVWSCGLRTVAIAAPSDDVLGSWAITAAAAFTKFWRATGSIRTFNPPNVTANNVSVRAISVAGVTTGLVNDTMPGNTGQGSQQTAPNQTALVATLLTAKAGRSGKGRFYLPFLIPTFGANDDRIPALTLQPLVDAAATFIHDLGTNVNTGVAPLAIAVQSRVATGAPPPVNRIAFGDVVDTQRRRRDKVRENYLEDSVIPPVVGP